MIEPHRSRSGRLAAASRAAHGVPGVFCHGVLEDGGYCSFPAASAGSASCASRNDNTVDKLLECVTVDGVRTHQAALQSIADADDGIRTSGTPGYNASAA